MFKEVTIRRLRGITRLDIRDFGQVNLLVGENNCGKTTVLEALFLLIGATNAELPFRINVYRDLSVVNDNTMRVLFNRLNVGSSINLSARLENPSEKRNLKIMPNMETKFPSMVREETLQNSSAYIPDSYSRPSSAMDGFIMKFSLTESKKTKPIRIITKATVTGSKIEFERPKEYKESRKAVFINRATVGAMSERFNDVQVKKGIERIVKTLRHVEPSLSDLTLGAGNVIFCDIGLDRLVPLNVIGNGMLRLLSIILAISGTQDGVVLIDEIENGLSYTSQKHLWGTIFEAAKEFNSQIFATTHSLECIRAFSAACSHVEQKNVRLYRIEKEDTTFRSIMYDRETLETSLESDWEVR
jgi:AAA15 family ATPase/GTPase